MTAASDNHPGKETFQPPWRGFGAAFVLNYLFLLHRRKLVQDLIWAQLNGKSTKTFLVSFQDSSPEQLLYPLTPAQLSCIRACHNFDSTIAEVRGIRPIEGVMNDCYFTVHYDIRGTGASGKSFAIQEDAYLRVCFKHRGQVIYWIVGARESF